MSDIEDSLDITSQLAVDDGWQSESSDEEVQDEILSEEEDDDKADQEFPDIELSDDDKDGKKDDDVLEYFSAPKVKKGSHGTFAGIGLSKGILNNIQRKGFKHPTPIQRKTIPLLLEGKDVVGMARTGSGKTAAFVLPMLERLKVHSARVGARALILSPSRELAQQTLKVVKEFSRGTDLRSVLLVGGDSLEDQFGYMMSNPDIIIATPGRFMHLKVEMQLDLKTIEYVVFDEADRLFEMGFAEQLNEILASLPSNRQTLLFSATLPKSLVDFAKAGLTDPTLVRLDAEQKVSEDLEMAFFSVKDGERDAALLYVLQEIIKMPTASEEQKKWLEARDRYGMDDDSDDDAKDGDNKGKRKKGIKKRDKLTRSDELPTPESTILFVPTKHHVEYVSRLLMLEGYSVSFIYGTLDQSARKEQLYRFRAGKTSIMVVTDVASRGIDIPVLANVINYHLPSSPKVFVHRVGRTARAGRRGWAYSLVKEADLAYLLDLEVFLGRKLLLSNKPQDNVDYTKRIVLGSLPREGMEVTGEDVEALLQRDYDLQSLNGVARRGEKLYNKSRELPGQESIKRAKDLISDGGWDAQHLLVGPSLLVERENLLEKLANRRIKETVFEFRKTSFGSTAELMARRRQQIAPVQRRAAEKKAIKQKEKLAGLMRDGEDHDDADGIEEAELPKATEDDIEDAFSEQIVADAPSKKRKHEPGSFRDPEFFMSHFASAQDRAEEKYRLSNSTFAGAAQSASFDLNDEGKDFVQKQGMKWDKKKGKYINAGSEGNVKYIRGENGQKIPASFRSGRFDAWKNAHKTSGPRIGALENSDSRFQPGSKKFKHNKQTAPKVMDKARDDYKVRKQRVEAAAEKGLKVKGYQKGGKPAGTGLNSTDKIAKQRQLKEKRREKNARPSKKGKSRR